MLRGIARLRPRHVYVHFPEYNSPLWRTLQTVSGSAVGKEGYKYWIRDQVRQLKSLAAEANLPYRSIIHQPPRRAKKRSVVDKPTETNGEGAPETEAPAARKDAESVPTETLAGAGFGPDEEKRMWELEEYLRSSDAEGVDPVTKKWIADGIDVLTGHADSFGTNMAKLPFPPAATPRRKGCIRPTAYVRFRLLPDAKARMERLQGYCIARRKLIADAPETREKKRGEAAVFRAFQIIKGALSLAAMMEKPKLWTSRLSDADEETFKQTVSSSK